MKKAALFRMLHRGCGGILGGGGGYITTPLMQPSKQYSLCYELVASCSRVTIRQGSGTNAVHVPLPASAK
jgi:hypothetical protein